MHAVGNLVSDSYLLTSYLFPYFLLQSLATPFYILFNLYGLVFLCDKSQLYDSSYLVRYIYMYVVMNCLASLVIRTIGYIHNFMFMKHYEDNFAGYITFFPGEMKITFEIKIEDDDTLEYDEIFDVTANASHNAIATVTIKDDDSKLLIHPNISRIHISSKTLKH